MVCECALWSQVSGEGEIMLSGCRPIREEEEQEGGDLGGRGTWAQLHATGLTRVAVTSSGDER